MRTKVYNTVKVPLWAMSYIFNSDDSGLSESDKSMVEGWYKTLESRCGVGINKIIISLVDGSDDGYFSWTPEFGLGCTVFDCYIIVTEQDN